MIEEEKIGIPCNHKGCDEEAYVDGWCREHSEQFRRFGTHYCVGAQGSQAPTGRHSTPPPSDVARLRVALWNVATHLGIDLDSSMADHQVAELIAHRLNMQTRETLPPEGKEP